MKVCTNESKGSDRAAAGILQEKDEIRGKPAVLAPGPQVQ